MSALIYGIRLQFRMDIRSRTLLVTCYLVPLLFFAVMGGIFTSSDAGSKRYSDRFHDSDGCVYGSADRSSALSFGNLWNRYKKDVPGRGSAAVFRTDLAGDISLCSSDDHERTDPCDSSGGI